VADRGVPVFLVPGNHERSHIPFPLLASHPGVHIFHDPETFHCRIRGLRVALSGFPFCRTARRDFPGLVRRTRFEEREADIRLLCIHQAVEGAQVGPADFTFRSGADVVRCADIPPGFAALLSGHIHRSQVLTRDLGGRSLPEPVLYPGSVERTSFAERGEEKHFLRLFVTADGSPGGRLTNRTFVRLPARPLIDLSVDPAGLDEASLRRHLKMQLAVLDPDAVVRIRLDGDVEPDAAGALGAGALRSLAPASMNVNLVRPRK
jgi:DNA repair exonuclease SbcCD nuclease subunit